MSAHFYLGVMCDSVRIVCTQLWGCIMCVCAVLAYAHIYGGYYACMHRLYTPVCTSKDICMGVKLYTCVYDMSPDT